MRVVTRAGSQLPLPGAQLHRPADRGQRRLRRPRRAPQLAGRRSLGRQPRGLRRASSAAARSAPARTPRATRCGCTTASAGAVGLGLAVLVADLLAVQHAFWVALATLSVLRSSALNTGQNIVRAVLGTTIGFVIGGGIVALVGTNTALLWVLLPFAVLLAGLAPATVSFAAGQAAFTLTLMILFNLLAPAGWQIGLVRDRGHRAGRGGEPRSSG